MIETSAFDHDQIHDLTISADEPSGQLPVIGHGVKLVHLGVKVIGAEIAQCRVATFRVVGAVRCNRTRPFGLVPRDIHSVPFTPFSVMRRSSRLLRCPIHSGAAHREGDAVVAHEALELLARILALRAAPRNGWKIKVADQSS